MEAYVAQTRKLTKKYGTFCALDQVDLCIRHGEIYGLVGDNGAGKSTLLKLLAGQIFVSDGEIALFGITQEKELGRERARIGVLIEETGGYPQLSVEKIWNFSGYKRGYLEKKRWMRCFC